MTSTSLKTDSGRKSNKREAAQPRNDAGNNTGKDSTALSALWQRIGENPSDASLWLNLARAYMREQGTWQAAYAVERALQFDGSLRDDVRALIPKVEETLSAAGRTLGGSSLANAGEIVDRLSAALAASPGDWLTCLYLARVHELAENAEESARLLKRAAEAEVFPGEVQHWMGVWRLQAGDPAGAVAALSTLIDIRPVRYGSMMYLGEALLQLGNGEAAEKAFARASLSNNASFLKMLAARVFPLNYWNEGIRILDKVIALDPQDVEARLSQAAMQMAASRLGDCRANLRRIASLAPDLPQLPLIEAAVLSRMGDTKSAFELLLQTYKKGDQALTRLPSSIAMTSLYHDGMSAEEKFNLHLQLCGPIAEALSASGDGVAPTTVSRRDGRLCVGYVSGDLYRQHPVGLLMQPILAAHDRKQFRINVYYTGRMSDAHNAEMRSHADAWVDAAGMSDAELRRRIIADGVDVLVNLSGHTDGDRLGVLIPRAAPVQASFLGYPHSTGLPGVDWLLADESVAPVNKNGLYSERVARLPDCVFCWPGGAEFPLPVPRAASEPVVFGSFNNVAKLTPGTIAVWARILAEVPAARLLLKGPSFADESVQQRYLGLFGDKGIDGQRIIFRSPSALPEMMAEYGDIDIALDPFPYNGGMTTLQALWMGVPVVTLAGENFAGRMGASLLGAIHARKWIADNADDYVAAAVRLAGACGKLRGQRDSLRKQVAASPLADGLAYTRKLESLLVSLADGKLAG